uniref:Egg protein CP3842 n=1 Tax=Schistosoma japonicum TaxID=6182 RepID=C1LXR6_SCHJA|nr:Egg protein CP3842 [Schistosoma japonicum]CAX79495.1 Egg protein CP3842 [Schistosoma japonicum]CAX79496.1 Egg protein CP3842 [Schistosoma japonicum]CAX79497.1 Egg protein CP3842 [Schistosoma japonicum]CAX79500.1 Egg protein CP3842 [Schistosoma japonicum]
MFKMRIINLVNISTVLLLINLLQTKSRLVGNENGFMLTVSIYGAQLSDKVTSVPVTWNGDYEDPEKSAFKKLVTDSCDTFSEYVKSQIPTGSVDGQCTSHIFQRPGSGSGVSISLTLSFIYVDVTQPDTAALKTKLEEHFENFDTIHTHKITQAQFRINQKAIVIPTGDKDAIDGSKWKIIAIVASVTLAIVVFGGFIYIYVK